MKFLWFVSIVVLLGCNQGGTKDTGNASAPLRFDGIYKSTVQINSTTGDQSTSYLRFYRDGTVINASSSGTPEQVKTWFVKGHDNVMQTTYQAAGAHLNFTFAEGNGAVAYDGEVISKEQLQLHTKSVANNREADVSYSFVAE